MEDCLRAYDWIRLADQVREQLAAAQAKLAESNDHPREQAWLVEAVELLAKDADARGELLARARRLPELAPIRQEHAADLIGPWSDALEHLHAGIVFHAGLRSPLIEALFPHRKFDVLRRGSLDAAQAYGADFQRRVTSSYIERLLAREEFAFARPSVDEVMARYAPLKDDGDDALGEEEAQALTAELRAVAETCELAIKQARLLAEAALLPLPGCFQELAIRNKPKTRAAAKPKTEVSEEKIQKKIDEKIEEAPPEPQEEVAAAPKPAKKEKKAAAPKPKAKSTKKRKPARAAEASA